MLTRVFKSGNSLVLRPVERRKLTGIAEAFAMFTPDYMAEGREFHEQQERNYSFVGHQCSECATIKLFFPGIQPWN